MRSTFIVFGRKRMHMKQTFNFASKGDSAQAEVHLMYFLLWTKHLSIENIILIMLCVMSVPTRHTTQAGSDSLLTSHCFFKLAQDYFADSSVTKHCGVLYGLGQDKGNETSQNGWSNPSITPSVCVDFRTGPFPTRCPLLSGAAFL